MITLIPNAIPSIPCEGEPMMTFWCDEHVNIPKKSLHITQFEQRCLLAISLYMKSLGNWIWSREYKCYQRRKLPIYRNHPTFLCHGCALLCFGDAATLRIKDQTYVLREKDMLLIDECPPDIIYEHTFGSLTRVVVVQYLDLK